IADYLSQDICSTGLCKLKFLEDQNTRALADHESIAFQIEWSRGMLRIIVASRKSPHRCKAGNGHRRDRALGAAADHRVGVTSLYQSKTVAYRVRTGRAGCGCCGIWTPGSVAYRHVAGREIDDGWHDKEW